MAFAQITTRVGGPIMILIATLLLKSLSRWPCGRGCAFMAR
ncbi:hypothetical protein ACKWRH_19165 [Bradyrhizobium sp. Pa8]